MTTDITIRAARQDEYELWLPLWHGYLSFYKTSLADEISRLTWQRFFDQREPMRCDVAEAGGAMRGIVHSIDHRSCWTAGNYCYLQDLFVDPAFRGQGLGRRLIEHVEAQARARGCSRMYWLTHETNTDAMQLYDRVAEKSGFVQYRKLLTPSGLES